MFDIGTISIILFFAIIALLAIGMPLGSGDCCLTVSHECAHLSRSIGGSTGSRGRPSVVQHGADCAQHRAAIG